ncbi:MAG: chromate transporter [Bradyrhizobium sp.]|nr:chromate transporter [Bradyrhizobium sp.]
MSPEMPPAEAAPALPKPAKSPAPGVLTLFFAFARMSLAGFGGVLAFARRGLVDERRWMTSDEFNEAFALCHFLPGPNIVNLSVVFGSRFGGFAGAAAAFAGLVGPPMVLVTALAVLYARFGQFELLRHILAGVSCAAAGLLIAVVMRMLRPLLERRDLTGLILMVAVFAAIGLMRWPLQAVLLVAVPVSLGITFLMRRKAPA